MLRLYTESTTFVMPSVFEAAGNVFLEAMAYGLPCIGSKACAMPEIIEDGVTGYLVKQNDIDGIYAAFSLLASDPGRCRRMGEAGRQRYLTHFTWDRVAEKIEEAVMSRL